MINGGNESGSNGDTIFGGDGADTIHGDNGNDVIDGGDLGDTIYGDLGDDILLGKGGNDTLYGGAARTSCAAGLRAVPDRITSTL